ncbi:MAG: hypothetical protein CMF81_01880 [Candidatus Marinimicrobia bacterium]|nr:hypothetical protein [Candidatus Neomarinimicrobiota bacterium]|tara:strand:- start:382 stop:1698 length:1317 start_codon:yes stop_codon:yes gene_type:complete
MTKPLSFSITYEKFGDSKKIKIPNGFHVVYGESGSGKTQFIKSLAGLKIANYQNFSIHSVSAPELVQIVFQNPETQILSHTIESELAFGLECQTTNSTILQNLLEKLKSQLPFVDNWQRHPASLSGGQMEMLNIVTALSTKPELLLIDDGLSYLNQNLKEYWINFIKREISSSCTVIWFTSDYNDLTFGDISWMLSLSDFSKISSLPFENLSYSYKHLRGRLRLVIDNISFAYEHSHSPVIKNWSCDINQARSIGLIGENGKGKTTLSKLITKILSLQSGFIDISIDGNRPSIAMLDQFPERMIGPESLENFISELITNEKLNPHLMKMCINKLKSSQINWDIIKNESTINIPWSTLRMAIIIILSYCNYDVLILDEPTFGMGIKQKVLLSKFLKEVISNKYLILISHDVYFIESHCDHIYDLEQQVVSFNDRVIINA